MLCFANASFTVPKESYMTFQSFLASQKSDQSFVLRAPSDWLKLTHVSPLIGKYQLAGNATLSISVFSGEIGDDLANVNRWRSQLSLDPLKALPKDFISYNINGIPVKQIQLSNDQTYFTIYWLTINEKHVFNKFVSTYPISESLMSTFIEGQSWQNI